MLAKTRGIVLNFIKFRETSIIVKVYTEEFGLLSLIINGVRSKKSKTGIALFQPLTLLDLVVFYKDNKAIKRLNEVRCSVPFGNIPFEIKKSCLTIFISEVLVKALKEEVNDKELFAFLFSAIVYLDQEKFNPDFHIWFLLRLSYFLGFGPENALDIVPSNSDFIEVVDDLITTDLSLLKLPSNAVRRRVLEYMITFYSGNMENFNDLKSLKVLNEILSDR